MSRSAELRCRCGKVRGVVHDTSASNVNRIVCYCDDCQAFVHHLGRSDLLDARGGSDLVQVAPSVLSFTEGSDLIVGLRLSPKGLYRWYSSCCNTPVGNTIGPSIPFVGILAQAFAGESGRGADEHFGKPIGAILGKYAIGGNPAGSSAASVMPFARTVLKVLSWKLLGRTWPHPFFDRATGAPRYPITVLSRAERDALRPLCGPHPTASPVSARLAETS